MEIYHSILDIDDRPSVVLAVGAFDGVHKGHRKIIDTVQALASERGAKTMLMTFDPIPKQYFGDESVSLTTRDEKMDLFRSCGIDLVAVCPFDRKFAQKSREQYMDELLKYLHIKAIVAGPDHHFGYKNRGDLLYLTYTGQVHGYDVRIVDKTEHEHQHISSGSIRKELIRGHIQTANAMLGYPYRLDGSVVKGYQRGRKMGIPTLNIKADDIKILPGNGVYCVRVSTVSDTYRAICNIGIRPTFDEGFTSVEVHVFDENLLPMYGQDVSLEFLKFIRHEKKFENQEKLIKQIELDINECKKWMEE